MVRDLASGEHAIMTGSAIAGINTDMIESRTGKIDIVTYNVTCRTVARRRQVIQGHASGDVTVVTHGAVGRIDTAVVEHRALEARCAQMTVSAILIIGIGWDMCHMFTSADGAIVTGNTGNRGIINTKVMIKHARGKRTGSVTGTAIQRGWHVID